MIVVKLMGGIGNQMFQYAYAVDLSEKYNEEILFDLSFYPVEKQLDLYRFGVQHHRGWEEAIPQAERKHIIIAQKKYRVLQKAKRVILHQEELGASWFYRNIEKGYYFNFDQYFYGFRETKLPNKYIYGYFQSEKYFFNIKERVKSLYRLTIPLSEEANAYLKMIEETNAVALHIRLGDYKKARNYYLDVCTPQYYQCSISYILDQTKKPTFFVFTNNAEEVKRYVSLPENTIIVTGTKDYEDFELIRSCKHVILSNSSFSWWATYLSQNVDIITAPTPWFTTLKRDSDIYLPGMKKIGV